MQVQTLGLEHLKIMHHLIVAFQNRLIDNKEELDVAMPMHNLIEYSKNYRKTTGSLWNYYRDELTDDRNNNSFPNKDVINSDSEVEIAFPLKYPSNFWKWKMKKSQTY